MTAEPRFFIDHSMIHDRVTGKHVSTDEDTVFCDGINACCALLNELSDPTPGAMTENLTDELVAWLRKVAPRWVEGRSHDFAFRMEGVSLQELNAKVNEAANTIEALKADNVLREAAKGLLERAGTTFKARNGRDVGIEADDGEKCWIVHSDDIEALRTALSGEVG